MPPKKPEKKDDKARDMSDPVQKNEVVFTIEFEMFHEKGHFVKLKYNWINRDTLEQDKLETEYAKDWEIIRKEGEETKPESAEPVKDDKKKQPPKDPK